MHDARCSSALGVFAAGTGRGDRERTQEMTGLDELRGCGGMTWSEAEQGWAAAPEEIVRALSSDGFEECKREVTTGRRDSRAAGGVWQGGNTRTGAGGRGVWGNG